MIQKYLSKKGGRFHCLFVDFSKAFDMIEHIELINCKLPSIYVFSYFPFGFEGGMWDLIVSVPDHCLPFYLKHDGINGIQISNDIGDILAILYANDIANVSDTVRALQAQIDGISAFCNRTEMWINMSKTKIIVFRNGSIIKDNKKCFSMVISS